MEGKIFYERLLKIAESMLDVIGERAANYDEAYEQIAANLHVNSPAKQLMQSSFLTLKMLSKTHNHHS